MIPLKTIKIRNYEMGLLFRDGEFKGLLAKGRHWLLNPLGKVRVDVVSQRDPWLVHEKLDVIVKSGALKDRAVVIDLKDDQRALVWIDGRFSHVLPPGLYAYWIGLREVRVEVIDARSVRFDHKDLALVLKSPQALRLLDVCEVKRDHAGVLFYDGKYVETLTPGRYAFWRDTQAALVYEVDLRETMLDVSGQEIMTADKVTLRLNAVAVYRVHDARQYVTAADDAKQALYRDAQLALRAGIGARELDDLLADKDGLANELAEQVRRRAGELGLELISVGIR
ncbi:MAG TPA: slipin family protein, partial [Pirellulales bacterium]|nr:slipin family protein [Pirellulales bacterium]